MILLVDGGADNDSSYIVGSFPIISYNLASFQFTFGYYGSLFSDF